MKSLKKIALALGGLSAVCMGFAVGTVASTQKAAEPATAASVSVHRLYVINSAWSEKYQLGIHIFGSSLTSYNTTWDSRPSMNWIDGTVSYGLFYYDIPDDASFDITQSNSSSGNAYQTVDVTPSTSGYSYLWSSQVLRVNWGGTNTKATIETVGGGMTTTSQIGNVLSYIVTCDSSSVYGYNAYPQLKGTFFDNTDAAITGSTDLTVRDYDYQDSAVYNMDTHSYVALTTRGTTSTVVGKIARLKANYDSQTNHANAIDLSTSDSSSTVVLGGLAITAVLAAGAYFFVRKKKAD